MKVSVLNMDGTIMVSSVTDENVAELMPEFAAVVEERGVDPATLVLGVLLGGVVLATPVWRMVAVADDEHLPEWAHRAFMARPFFWPNGLCALAKADQPLPDRELGMLGTDEHGRIWFAEGNIMCSLPPEEGRRYIDVVEVRRLYDDGWRVD